MTNESPFDALIAFWNKYDCTKKGKHQDDLPVDLSYLEGRDDVRLHTELLPQTYCGDIRRAPIVLLALNPGYAEKDDEKIEKEIEEELSKQIKQEESLGFFWLNSMYDYLYDKEKYGRNGFIYWRDKFDQGDKNKSLIESLWKQYNGSAFYGNDRQSMINDFSKIICSIELFPYHSKKFGVHNGDLNRFPSANKAYEAVHKSIKEETNRLFICMRSWQPNYWNLGEQNNVCLNNENRNSPLNPSFNQELKMGKRILSYIKDNTNGFTNPLSSMIKTTDFYWRG